MKLCEVFDSPLSYEWVHQSDVHWEAIFLFADRTYKVYADDTDYKGNWDIGFKNMDADNGYERDPVFSGENVVRVYSTVIHALQEFVVKNEVLVHTIHFEAYNSATESLYSRIVKNIELPNGWKMKVVRDGESITLINTKFVGDK